MFYERGAWQGEQEENINFSHSFRWTIDRRAALIFLEHLATIGNDLLASIAPHVYAKDVYQVTVPWDRHSIRLNWRVIAPKKMKKWNMTTLNYLKSMSLNLKMSKAKYQRPIKELPA